MRGFLFLLIFFVSFGLQATPEEEQQLGPIYGDIEIPDNYFELKRLTDDREQVIPMEANKATSPGAFGGKILEYHLADLIENNQIKPLQSVKDFEKTFNEATQLKGPGISVKSKLDLNRLKAEVDIQSVVNTKLWTEDSFKTLRAQMKLYELESGLISIENKTNQQDSRTYLNLEKTW